MKLKKRNYIHYQSDEYSLRRDDIFRYVLGSNYHSRYLKNFLESLLNQKISNIVVKNDVRIIGNRENSKDIRLDILAELDTGEQIDIEMQNKKMYNIDKRSEFYANKIMTNKIDSGQSYDDVNKIILIWILDFNIFDTDNYHEIATMRTENNIALNSNITYHYIQLPKFIETTREIVTRKEQWLASISHQLNSKELEELCKMNHTYEEVEKMIKEYRNDPELQYMVDTYLRAENERHLIREQGLEDGEKIGKEKGINENKRKIAKKMKEANEPIEKIMQFTELTKEEIEKL